jgi:hypothetical protein
VIALIRRIRDRRRLLELLACVVLFDCLSGCVSDSAGKPNRDPEYLAGRRSARSDIEGGEIKFIDASGIRRFWTDDERRSLEEEYGIGHKDGRGMSGAYVEGYNKEMFREAASKFGPDYHAKLVYKSCPELGYPRHSRGN